MAIPYIENLRAKNCIVCPAKRQNPWGSNGTATDTSFDNNIFTTLFCCSNHQKSKK